MADSRRSTQRLGDALDRIVARYLRREPNQSRSRALVALYTTHLGGHATRWGGTALTDPHRASSLARDNVYDASAVTSSPRRDRTDRLNPR